MKNKEKYEKEIMNIACNGDSIAILKKSGRIVSCNVRHAYAAEFLVR